MTYSKIHQLFSDYLERPDALTNPEKYLGPNWEDVLNFWIYIDTLSEQEREEMYQFYCALNYNVRKFAIIASRNAADEIISWRFRFAAWYVAWYVTGFRVVFGNATEELIGSHEILDQNKALTFLPVCIKS